MIFGKDEDLPRLDIRVGRKNLIIVGRVRLLP